MRRYDLVIFDFEGTLADSAPWFIGVLNDLAARHGFRAVSDAEIAALRRLPTRDIVRNLGIRFWQLPGIARELRRRSADAADGIALFEGVSELLAELAQSGTAVAIVSSNGEVAVRAVLGESARHVSQFACGSSLFGKARRIARLRRTLGATPARTLHVGDETRDIDAARKAGVAAGAATYGYSHPDPLLAMSPDAVFHSVANIRETCLPSSAP